MGFQVADLVAKLGLKWDRTSFKKGRDALGRFTKQSKWSLGGLGKQMDGLGAKVGTVFGGLAAYKVGKDAFNFEDKLNDLEVAARGAAGTVDEMRDKMLGVSDATGVSKEEVLAGVSSFVEITGAGDEANDAMGTFARTAVATRANMGDIAEVGGRLYTNMGLVGSQFEQAFSILAAGGKEGSVEFRNLASELGSLAPQVAQFAGGKGLGGVAQLGAALQIGAQGFNSASEAATGFQGMITALLRRTDEFKKAGVRVYGKNGQLRNLQDIVNDLASKNLSGSELVDLFGRIEGKKFFDALTRVDGAWQGMIDKTINATDIQDDFARKMEMDTQKVRVFWVKIKNEITRSLSVVIDWLGKTVDWLGEVGVETEHILTVIKILAAFVALNAVRMAISWTIAFGPLGLVAGTIGLITAAIIDLFSTADGKEGWVADVLGPDAAFALRSVLRDAKDELLGLWELAMRFVAWIHGQEGVGTTDSAQSEVIRQARKRGDLVQAAEYADPGRGGTIRRLKDLGVSAEIRRGLHAFMRDTGIAGASSLSEIMNRARDDQLVGEVSGPPRIVTNNANIRIQVPAGTDAAGVAQAAARAVEEVLDRKAREL